MKKYFWFLLVIALSGFFNAVMDQLDFRASESIFTLISNDNIRLWIIGNGVFKQEWMRPFFPFLFDGWHCSKWFSYGLMLALISYLAADKWLHRLYFLLATGFVFMFFHMIFFKGILGL